MGTQGMTQEEMWKDQSWPFPGYKESDRDEYLWGLVYNREKGKLEAGEDSMFQYIHTPRGRELQWRNDMVQDASDFPTHKPIPGVTNPFNKRKWYDRQRRNSPTAGGD